MDNNNNNNQASYHLEEGEVEDHSLLSSSASSSTISTITKDSALSLSVTSSMNNSSESEGTSDDERDDDAIGDLRRQIESLGDQIAVMENLLQAFRTEQLGGAGSVGQAGGVPNLASTNSGNLNFIQTHHQQHLPPSSSDPQASVTRRFITTTIRINRTTNPPVPLVVPSIPEGAIRKRRSRYQKIGSQKSNFHKYMRHYMNVSSATIGKKKNNAHPNHR